MSEVFYIGERHIRVEKLNRKHKVENESTCKKKQPQYEMEEEQSEQNQTKINEGIQYNILEPISKSVHRNNSVIRMQKTDKEKKQNKTVSESKSTLQKEEGR